MIQTALELLGWVYLVEDPTTSEMAGSQFDKLNATEKIRRLLDRLRIPTIIPTDLTNLSNVASVSSFSDGPEAFVKIRNGVVHPKKAKRDFVLQIPRLARSEAQQIGLWYLELVLLNLLGYTGVYYRRYLNGFSSEVRDRVPWS